MQRNSRALVCAVLGFSSAAMAQAVSDESPVIVTASRHAELLDAATADVSVIDAQTIAAAGQSTLIDLLRLLPGVEVVTQGGPGQPASIFLRGANSNHTVVLIDGVRQTSLNLGLGSLQSLPAGAIERIEVVRAPASGQYGADAVGGVIQVFTRAGQAGTSAAIGAGSYGRRRADAALGTQGDGWRGGVSVAFDHSNGFDAVLPSNFAHHPDADSHEQRSVQANFSTTLGGRGELGIRALSARNDTDIDAEFPPYSSAPAARSRQDIRNLALVADVAVTEQWTTHLQMGENRDRYRWIDTLSFDDDIENTTRLVSWLNDVTVGKQRLRLGVEQQRQTLDAAATTYASHSRRTRSLLAGYHLDAGDMAAQFDLRRDSVPGIDTVTSGSLGLSHRLDAHWVVDARWGKAFKLPTFNDLYYVDPWGYFVANPALAPETAYTGELGVTRRAGATRVAARVFSSHIDGLIANYDPDGFLGPLPGTVVNTGKARIDGLSIDARLPLGDWQVTTAATWQYARDADSGERLPRRARAHGSVTLSRSVGEWQLAAELAAQGARFDSLPNSAAGRLGGYAIANLRAQRQLTPSWSMLARWNNVFDKSYALAKGYPVPGDNLFVELRYTPR